MKTKYRLTEEQKAACLSYLERYEKPARIVRRLCSKTWATMKEDGYLRTTKPHRADEAAQLGIVRGFATYDPLISKPTSYIPLYALNYVQRMYRKQDFLYGLCEPLGRFDGEELHVEFDFIDAIDEAELVLRVLDPRTKLILEKRWGTNCSRMTLEAIATEFGLSKQRVLQIQDKALEKIRTRWSNKR